MPATPTKIVLPGGSGYLGRALTDYFAHRGWNVVILSRQLPPESSNGARFVRWDGETLGDWARELEGASAVVNLAGRTVNCRYNAPNKARIYASRLRSTQVLGEAIAACEHAPPIWINSSSATIYRHALDRDMDEASGEIGSGFSVDVCLKWEQALAKATTPGTRKVALRSSMVFGAGDDGVMDAFETLVRRGLGGTLGPGNQFVSWVHERDFARAIEWIVEHEELRGPVNCAAPHPVPNREFMATLREEMQQRVGLPASKWMLQIGAFFMGTETELLLKSRRVVPAKLLDSGFEFEFPFWQQAARAILVESRA